MLLILEIGLTIAAWKRGWKGYALIPGVAALALGFISGLITGAEEVIGISLVFDVICIIALILMTAIRRKVKKAAGGTSPEMCGNVNDMYKPGEKSAI